MTETYSAKAKAQMQAVEVRKKCCRFTAAALEGPEFTADAPDTPETAEKLREIWQKCRCDNCRLVWIRAVFCRYGSVTDPEKAYHLDFSFREEETADFLQEILADAGFDFRKSTRKSRFVLYVKDHALIEDFLISLGAQTAAFDLMNSKIRHEFLGGVNRLVNCDTANLKKQVEAGRKYSEAIRYLSDCGKLETLPADLRETAALRLENDQVSLTELGQLSSPPVSKSGIRHRLERILAAAQALREENGKAD